MVSALASSSSFSLLITRRVSVAGCCAMWESGFSAGNGSLHGGHIGQLHVQAGGPSGWVVNRLCAGAAVDALAVDQVSDGCHDLYS